VALRITDERMVSDTTYHTAEWRPDAAADGTGAWVSSRVPGRLLDRNAAVTALTLAEFEATGQGDSPHAAGWRAELGIEAPGRPRPRPRQLR
jgi:hypothetical protein